MEFPELFKHGLQQLWLRQDGGPGGRMMCLSKVTDLDVKELDGDEAKEKKDRMKKGEREKMSEAGEVETCGEKIN